MWRKIIEAWKSDNLMEQSWNRSFEMLQITHDMFVEAVKTLRETSDENISASIREKDKRINSYQQEVRRNVMTHLAVQGVHDLPGGLILVSIVIDLERLGDYTKNIVDLNRYRYCGKMNGYKYEEVLQNLEKAIAKNFVKTLDCIKKSNTIQAAAVLDENAWVAGACEKTVKDLVREKDEHISAGDAASLGIYVRYLKRINAHLRNITSSIVNPFDRIGFQNENNNDAQPD